MIPPTSFLDTLQAATLTASQAEDEFRRSIVARTKELEQDRAFAFRRLNLMRSVAEVVSGAESEEIAVAAANAILRNKLGWSSDSEAREEVLARFVPVAQSMFATLSPSEDEGPEPDFFGALSAFESWYAQSHTVPFWKLFENYMPETPLVDF